MLQHKTIITLLTVRQFTAGCKGVAKKKPLFDFDESDPGPTQIEFLDGTKHNFVTPSDSMTLVHYFRFKVGDDVPLVITLTLPSCGCTETSHSYRPIIPCAIDSILLT